MPNYCLNVSQDNIASMTHSATTFKATLSISVTDQVTADVIRNRLNAAIQNLGEDAEIELSYSESRYTSVENQAF